MTKADNINIFKGDITKLAVDAIVNAANPSLGGGGGVDGAIHAAAGRALTEAALKLAPCPVGEARITPGFNLPARFVIHTVGPIWRGGDSGEADLLTKAYHASYMLARDHGCATIALPAISCGAYGYPIREAVEIALDVAHHHRDAFEEISFPCFDGRVLHAFQQLTKPE